MKLIEEVLFNCFNKLYVTSSTLKFIFSKKLCLRGIGTTDHKDLKHQEQLLFPYGQLWWLGWSSCTFENSHNGQWTTASCNLSPEGNAWKENKLEYFENKNIFCFKLQCASIVYLLCTALWWQIERRGVPLSNLGTYLKFICHGGVLVVSVLTRRYEFESYSCYCVKLFAKKK